MSEKTVPEKIPKAYIVALTAKYPKNIKNKAVIHMKTAKMIELANKNQTQYLIIVLSLAKLTKAEYRNKNSQLVDLMVPTPKLVQVDP